MPWDEFQIQNPGIPISQEEIFPDLGIRNTLHQATQTRSQNSLSFQLWCLELGLFLSNFLQGGWESNKDLLEVLNNAYSGHIRGKRQQV